MTSIQFRTPCSIYCVGSSQCGKSTFVGDIIRNASTVFTVKPREVIWIYKYKSPELERLLEAGLIHRLIHGPVTYEQIQRICGYSDTTGDDDGMNGSFARETPNSTIKRNVEKNRGGSSCVHRVIIIDDLLKSMAKVRECVRVCVRMHTCMQATDKK